MKAVLSFFHNVLLKITIPTRYSNKYKLILLLFGLGGMILVLLSTSLFGAGLSPDSVYYISIARNFADGKGLITYLGDPVVVWPPLYPILLAIPSILFKIDPLISAHVINAILFGLTVYFSGLLLSRHLDSSVVFSLLGTAVLLFSNILQDIFIMVWSETLFIFFVILFLFFLEKYIQKSNDFLCMFLY